MEDCQFCKGTGINPSGRIDDPCPYCKGTGVTETIEDIVWDEDPYMDWDEYEENT